MVDHRTASPAPFLAAAATSGFCCSHARMIDKRLGQVESRFPSMLCRPGTGKARIRANPSVNDAGRFTNCRINEIKV